MNDSHEESSGGDAGSRTRSRNGRSEFCTCAVPSWRQPVFYARNFVRVCFFKDLRDLPAYRPAWAWVCMHGYAWICAVASYALPKKSGQLITLQSTWVLDLQLDFSGTHLISCAVVWLNRRVFQFKFDAYLHPCSKFHVLGTWIASYIYEWATASHNSSGPLDSYVNPTSGVIPLKCM